MPMIIILFGVLYHGHFICFMFKDYAKIVKKERNTKFKQTFRK